MKRYCGGDVLDVGGWDFFLSAGPRGVPFTRWITIDINKSHLLDLYAPHYFIVQENGYCLPFRECQFDSVLSIQVLEHVFDPMRMVQEIARVMKPGGSAVFLIPQTANVHLAP